MASTPDKLMSTHRVHLEKAAVTSSPRTRLIATALTACLVPALAACGAGFHPEVDDVTGQNAAANVGGILARDIVVVKAPQAPAAALAGTLINNGSQNDTLQTVSFTDDAPGSQTVTITPNLAIAAGQLLPLGAEGDQPITIPNAAAITVGDFVGVVLNFAQAGDMHMQVAAADREFYFSSIGPAPTPAGAATQADAASRATVTGTHIVTDKPGANPAASPAPKAQAPKTAAKAAVGAAAPAKTPPPKTPAPKTPAKSPAPTKSAGPAAKPAALKQNAQPQ
jgi:hypothetical protein